MIIRVVAMAVWVATVAFLTGLLLVPTGMCVCADHGDDDPCESHPPGCPKVRKLDRSAPAVTVMMDTTPVALAMPTEAASVPVDSPQAIRSGHGPPRGRPLYLTHRHLVL